MLIYVDLSIFSNPPKSHHGHQRGHCPLTLTPSLQRAWCSACNTLVAEFMPNHRRTMKEAVYGNTWKLSRDKPFIHAFIYIYIHTKYVFISCLICSCDGFFGKKSNVTYHKAGFPFRSTRPKTPATFRTRVRAFRMGRLCPTCVRPRCSFQRFWGTSGRQDATWHHIIQQGVPLLYSWKCRWNSIFQKYFHILNGIKDRTIKS